MRILRWLLISVLLMALLVACLLGFTLYTQTGLRWTLAAVESSLPGALTIDEIEGRLAGPLTLANLRYRDASVAVDASRIVFDWNPGKLLDRELEIALLRAERVDVRTTATPDETPRPATGPIELPDLRLPLAIRIVEARLDELTVQEINAAQPFSVDDIRTALSFDGQTLTVQRLEGQTTGISLSVDGQLTPTGNYPLSLTGYYSLSRDGFPTLNAELTVSGDLARVQIDHQTLTPVSSQLAATVTAVLDKPAWEVRLQVQQFDTETINPAWEPLTVGGSAHSEGSFDDYRFELETQLGGARIPAGSWSFSGTGTPDTIEVQTLRGETAAGVVSGRLRVEDVLAAPRWDAALQVQQLDTTRLDPNWEALVLNGKAHSQGWLDGYSFELDARVQGTRIPEGHWSVAGTGTTQAIDVQSLRAETLAGVISANAQVQWAPYLKWRLTTEATGIDPGFYWPDWPGRVDFALHGNGSRQQDRYHAAIELTRLSGTLAQQPVSASGKLSADHQGFAISELDVNAAGAHLFASGQLTDRWALRWSLEAPDLAALYPASRGALTASGDLTGPRNNPGISMNVRGNQLGFQQHRTQSLVLLLDWSPDDSKASRLDLQAFDLLLDGQQVSQLDIRGTGLASNHKVNLAIDADALQFSGRITGGYKERSWQGLLSAASLALPPSGDWRLENPAQLQISGQRAAVSELCLANRSEGHACVEGSWGAEAGWQAKLRAQTLPLALLEPFLPDDLSAQGTLQLTAQAQQPRAGKPQAELELSSASGALLYQTVNQERLSFDYRDFQITGSMQEGVARLATRAELGAAGRLNGRLELPLSAFDPPSQRIEGTLTARLGDMSFLQALIPAVDQVKGELAVDLAARGTLQEPDIDLDLALKDGEVSLPTQGITLRNISLHAEPETGGIILFRGQAASGDGNVDLTGKFTPGRDDGWRVNMALQGSRFQAIDVTEYQVLVSPDLKVDMTAASARVSGTVTVPEARLRPKQVSGAVRPSRDVIIVREGEQEAAGYAVYSTVRLDLGQYVRFDGFGLKGRFTGSVVVSDAPNQLASGTGELRIQEGTYKAYGQNLKIERGRLILVGGPLDNPGLDIRAVREVGNVTAGLNITGELREPAVSVFSDPAMSETEALSYLVLGRPLPQDDSEDREQVNSASAALALGVGGASLLGEKFGERVGIDEVGVETESATGEVTLKLGTYLRPDLFVGYGRGLANQVNSFLVRYRLTKSLSVETESSTEAMGGDIFYTIER
jgi:translocation and assembly module TamB